MHSLDSQLAIQSKFHHKRFITSFMSKIPLLQKISKVIFWHFLDQEKILKSLLLASYWKSIMFSTVYGPFSPRVTKPTYEPFFVGTLRMYPVGTWLADGEFRLIWPLSPSNDTSHNKDFVFFSLLSNYTIFQIFSFILPLNCSLLDSMEIVHVRRQHNLAQLKFCKRQNTFISNTFLISY